MKTELAPHNESSIKKQLQKKVIEDLTIEK